MMVMKDERMIISSQSSFHPSSSHPLIISSPHHLITIIISSFIISSPHHLITIITLITPSTYQFSMYFDQLDLNDNVLDALYDMHFDECTPIQEKCIPEILNGRDVLGVAQTGTGKTAAYLLPILSKLDDGGFPKDAINCIIMSPTRELAQQIDQAMQGFGYYLDGVSSVAVYGGNDGNRYDQEIKSLRLGADVIIATPGRLISHLSLGNVDMSKVSFSSLTRPTACLTWDSQMIS